MQISKSMINLFWRIWDADGFPYQRLGQAFYNHFKLGACDRTKPHGQKVDRLFNCPDHEARMIIREITDEAN